MSDFFRNALKRFHPEGIPWPASLFYNAVSQTSAFRSHYAWVAEDLARAGAAGRLLDVGTGPGWLLLELLKRLPELDVVGSDISPAMAAQARKNMDQAGYGAEGHGYVDIQLGGAGALPFINASFDWVVSTGSLHHWKDPVQGIEDIRRVLKPGGQARLYDLVLDTPKPVLRAMAQTLGRFRTSIYWLHTFEEPFRTVADMQALVRETSFRRAETKFVGLLCCLALRKEGGEGASAL